MELVFFIIPSVFLLVGVCYCLFLTFGIPQDSVLQLNWGVLHTGDFRRMTEQQCLLFRKKILQWLPLAVVLTGVLGVTALSKRAAHQGYAVLFGYLAVQFVAGFFVLLPTFRYAKRLKQELHQDK